MVIIKSFDEQGYTPAILPNCQMSVLKLSKKLGILDSPVQWMLLNADFSNMRK